MSAKKDKALRRFVLNVMATRRTKVSYKQLYKAAKRDYAAGRIVIDKSQ